MYTIGILGTVIINYNRKKKTGLKKKSLGWLNLQVLDSRLPL